MSPVQPKNALNARFNQRIYPIISLMKSSGNMCHLVALLLLCSQPALATTVYKSVDDSGVVNFSDTLIEENVLLEEVEIRNEANPSDEDVQQRLDDMRTTTDRMAADRMAREKHRAEMRELAAKSNASRAPDYYYPANYDYGPVYSGSGYYDYSYRGNYRRDYRKHGRVRPRHPIARPPLRPQTRPSYRDNFPAPHIRPLFTPRTRGAPRH